jgi:uncharacterized membrane protein YkvA (DUF1232 family)
MDVVDSLTEDTTTVVLVVIAVVAVVMLAVAVFYFIKLLRTFRLAHNQLMPLGGKLAFWAALVYTILPVDVLPDPLLFDDIGVLALAVAYINHLARQHEIDLPELET